MIFSFASLPKCSVVTPTISLICLRTCPLLQNYSRTFYCSVYKSIQEYLLVLGSPEGGRDFILETLGSSRTRNAKIASQPVAPATQVMPGLLSILLHNTSDVDSEDMTE